MSGGCHAPGPAVKRRRNPAAGTITIGLAGNPNAGKTSIFNALTGEHQKVGNYAGVTVEKKEGRRVYRGIEFVIYDLPGIYSLTAYSIDEVIARDFIIEEKPDVIIDVLDATNLERNLYLCLQFQELGIPVVGALNISDQAEERGITIDAERLGQLLGIPMVRTVGSRGKNVEDLLNAACEVLEGRAGNGRHIDYGLEVERELAALTAALGPQAYPARWFAAKLLEKDSHAEDKLGAYANADEIRLIAAASIKNLETHFGRDAEIVISEQRYAYIRGTIQETVTRDKARKTVTEKIDAVLLNRFLGLPIFLFILWSVFQLTFTIGAFPRAWLDALFGWLGAAAAGVIPAGLVRSLVVNGIIGGVGNVFSFIPLIVLLFVFISLLEDSGYMARSAFIMDKFLHLFGLHGQSFLPMMIGFGCSVPAIMAARTLKNRKDRIVTILVTPLMSCGAKLPVYVLLAGAFFPSGAGTVVLSIYLIGVCLAFLASLVIRKKLMKGDSTPFVMELPPYRLPTARGIAWHVWDKLKHYVKKAGTVILAASIIIWVLTSFPQPAADPAHDAARLSELTSRARSTLEQRIRAAIADPSALAGIADETERATLAQSIGACAGTAGLGAAEGRRSAQGEHRRQDRDGHRTGHQAPRLRLEDRHRHHHGIRRQGDGGVHAGDALQRSKRRAWGKQYAARSITRRSAVQSAGGLCPDAVRPDHRALFRGPGRDPLRTRLEVARLLLSVFHSFRLGRLFCRVPDRKRIGSGRVGKEEDTLRRGGER
jgi:ferrous iron transport protein B